MLLYEIFVGDRMDKDVSKIEEVHTADDKDVDEISRILIAKNLEAYNELAK